MIPFPKQHMLDTAEAVLKLERQLLAKAQAATLAAAENVKMLQEEKYRHDWPQLSSGEAVATLLNYDCPESEFLHQERKKFADKLCIRLASYNVETMQYVPQIKINPDRSNVPSLLQVIAMLEPHMKPQPEKDRYGQPNPRAGWKMIDLFESSLSSNGSWFVFKDAESWVCARFYGRLSYSEFRGTLEEVLMHAPTYGEDAD